MTGPLPCGRPYFSRGMTLLEIMVVVIIIAIIVSMAVVNIGDSRTRTLDREAQRLSALIRMGADNAVLQGREIGLTIYEDNYLFVVYDDQTRNWNSLQDDSVFRPRKLPQGVTMELALDDRQLVMPEADERTDNDEDDQADDDDNQVQQVPHILLLSSGEMTPFELRFEIEGVDMEMVLRGSPTGNLEQTIERL